MRLAKVSYTVLIPEGVTHALISRENMAIDNVSVHPIYDGNIVIAVKQYAFSGRV